MDFVTALRDLRSGRVLVAGAAVLAVVVGLLVAFQYRFPLELRSRHYQVGIASARALVDTPRSAVVDLGTGDSTAVAMLPGRAALLATVMASSPLKDEIARRAGVPPSRLIATAAGTTPSGDAQPADTQTHVDERRAYRLGVEFEADLPILIVDTQAPDAAAAQRLADQSIAVLIRHLQSVAGVEGVPDARRLVVKPLGPARAGTTTRGPRRLYAAIASLLVFAAGCAAIVAAGWLRRTWRLTAELDQLDSLAGHHGQAPAEPDPQEPRGRAVTIIPFAAFAEAPTSAGTDNPRRADPGTAV